MPQAPSHLQAMFEDDSDAWATLAGNFTDTAGMIRSKPGYAPADADFNAISYLVLEWDYGYEEQGSITEQAWHAMSDIRSRG